MKRDAWQLVDLVLRENDEENEEEEGEETEEESEESESEEEEETEEESEEGKKKPKKLSATQQLQREKDAIQAALRKERLLRRKAEREARAAKRQTPSRPAPKKGTKGQEDSDQETQSAAELTAARERETRLSARLRDAAVDNLIARLAPKFNFADPEDAMRLVSRKDIDVDQDDEDPSDVEVDEDSVRDALKKLARKKPHLLVKPKRAEKGEEGEESGDEGSKETASKRSTTGSKFGGKKRTKDGLSEEELRKKYPALGGRLF